ncbi:MAG: VIT family protein [Nostocoides sp.]
MTDQSHESEPHEGEQHEGGLSARLNALRAGVLGANDGIVSTAGIVIGVAAATTSRAAIATAGLAGLAAGAMSMAVGEYVSVSTQRDTERAMVAREIRELREQPAEELAELTGLYADRGLSPDLARQVAEQLTAHDALAAHAEVELGIDPDDLANPWHAAFASMGSFTVGASLPVVAILLSAQSWRVPVTVVAVLLALVLTGWASATVGRSPVPRAVVRNLAGGALAMAITYAVGRFVGAHI